MALFGKKTCPNCGQPQEKNWDKCPFCINMGMGGGGAAMGGSPAPMGGPPMGGPPMGGPPMGGGMTGAAMGYGPPPGGGYGAAPGAGGAAQKTMMFQGGVAGSQAVQLLGWIIPLKGPHRGELHTLKPSSTIGKDPTCDVVFNDAFLSGRHATIKAQGGAFVLEDHSTNGTWVNDKKISRHELVDNDFVKFGQTLVKFKCL